MAFKPYCYSCNRWHEPTEPCIIEKDLPMNDSPNFGAILDKPTAEIQRPPAFPQGSYVAVVQGLPEFGKSSKKQTEQVEFQMKPLQAMEDVDEEALKEFGPFGDKTLKYTFYLTDKSIYRLKEFLINDLQIEEQASLRPMIDETPGQQCIIHIKHTGSEDGKSVFANISSTAPIEG